MRVFDDYRALACHCVDTVEMSGECHVCDRTKNHRDRLCSRLA